MSMDDWIPIYMSECVCDGCLGVHAELQVAEKLIVSVISIINRFFLLGVSCVIKIPHFKI